MPSECSCWGRLRRFHLLFAQRMAPFSVTLMQVHSSINLDTWNVSFVIIYMFFLVGYTVDACVRDGGACVVGDFEFVVSFFSVRTANENVGLAHQISVLCDTFSKFHCRLLCGWWVVARSNVPVL